jgi:hypothetical protein
MHRRNRSGVLMIINHNIIYIENMTKRENTKCSHYKEMVSI